MKLRSSCKNHRGEEGLSTNAKNYTGRVMEEDLVISSESDFDPEEEEKVGREDNVSLD